MVPEPLADSRAELIALAETCEGLLDARIRGLGALEWTDETYGGELIGLAATVRPARAHSGGAVVTVYENDELGLTIGPSELRFFVHSADGWDRAVDAIAAAVRGGALVEVYRRWWRTSTRVTVPFYGKRVVTSVWHHEFPGYPLGAHVVGPALITDVGRSGATVTHNASEVAVGTAIAGDHAGARVAVVDDGGYLVTWDGPGDGAYRDTWHDASEMPLAFHEYDEHVSWDWIDSEFAALVDAAAGQ